VSDEVSATAADELVMAAERDIAAH